MVNEPARLIVQRVQTGVRIEKRLLKVLKAFADYHDLTLGDLLEGIVLHVFDGKCPFGRIGCARLAVYPVHLQAIPPSGESLSKV
jgi:hypothetical protein